MLEQLAWKILPANAMERDQLEYVNLTAEYWYYRRKRVS